MFQLKREEQPILIPQGDGFEANAVFNPGICKKEGVVYMLYRAIGDLSTYVSHFGLATSTDNRTFKRVRSEPVFSPRSIETKGAVEDPRIVEIEGIMYVSYVAVPQQIFENGAAPLFRETPLITSGALLTTSDFISFHDLGNVTPLNSDNKDMVLFPEKINGKYAMLHRPFFWSKKGIDSAGASSFAIELPCEKELLPEKPLIWLSYSHDLHQWEDHVIMYGLVEKMDDKIGPGMPPIRTPHGWLLIYHHVQNTESGNVYSAKAALLDLEDPSKVIARLPYSILYPETTYEIDGFVKNVVFPTGGFIEDDILYVYYGAGDSSIGLATGSVTELMAEFDIYHL